MQTMYALLASYYDLNIESKNGTVGAHRCFLKEIPEFQGFFEISFRKDQDAEGKLIYPLTNYDVAVVRNFVESLYQKISNTASGVNGKIEFPYDVAESPELLTEYLSLLIRMDSPAFNLTNYDFGDLGPEIFEYLNNHQFSIVRGYIDSNKLFPILEFYNFYADSFQFDDLLNSIEDELYSLQSYYSTEEAFLEVEERYPNLIRAYTKYYKSYYGNDVDDMIWSWNDGNIKLFDVVSRLKYQKDPINSLVKIAVSWNRKKFYDMFIKLKMFKEALVVDYDVIDQIRQKTGLVYSSAVLAAIFFLFSDFKAPQMAIFLADQNIKDLVLYTIGRKISTNQSAESLYRHIYAVLKEESAKIGLDTSSLRVRMK